MEFDRDLTSLITILVTIVVALAVHEMMHAWVGLKLGDTTAKEKGRISFNPLAHIDPYMTVALPIITLVLFGVPILAAKPVPFNPLRVKWDEYGAALIALAGPVSNIVMASIAAILVRVFFPTVSFVSTALVTFTAVNVGIFVFNMVPIPPLDGSRVLYAFAPESVQKFMAQMELYGLFVVFALVILFPPFSELLININTSILRFLL
ncbi:site-2 protease family protein [Candidatus Saccharibacteria bacterium]|nr:site-2 protease family protein [Candidatus Saccharibacteria bacterium]